MSVLQFGIPGGPELLIIALNFVIIAAVVYAVYSLVSRRAARTDRVAELERQVGRLDRRVEELENERDGQ